MSLSAVSALSSGASAPSVGFTDLVWAKLETIVANASSTITFDTIDVSKYTMYKILIDSAQLSGNGHLQGRIKTSSGTISSGSYGYLGHSGSGTSIETRYSTSEPQWPFGSNSGDHAKTGEILLSATADGLKTTAYIRVGSGTSTADAQIMQFGAIVNNTQAVTGFVIFPNTGNIQSGKFTLYGLR